MRCTLLLAAVSMATLASADPVPAGIQEWVDSQGGSLERNLEGEVLSIDLSRSWINDSDLRRVAGLARLERLAIAQTHITDSSLSVVETLPALKDLDLFFCEHITDAGASRLRGAPNLEKLNVRGTKISDSGVQFLTELRKLRILDVGITEISDATIELLEGLPHLESLAIGGNQIAEAGIARLRSLKGLRHLDLSGAQVTDSGIWAVKVTDLNLDEIGALSGLESLVLAAPSPEYVDSVSSGVPRLRGAIVVTDFGASHLAKLAKLRLLNVARSALTATGIEQLQPLTRLEELVLAHAKAIDDSAGPALAKLSALRVLNVSYTEFGDAGLAALRDHPSLQRVIAVGTSLGADAISEFERAGPGRRVLR